MSRENVELVRRAVEAFLANDWETTADLVNPGIEWEETSGLGPDASIYRGLGEARAAVESWTGKWAEYQSEIREYVDAGDQVVVLLHERGRGQETGAAVERESGQVLTVRDGRIIRNRLYGSWDEALEAVGLRE